MMSCLTKAVFEFPAEYASEKKLKIGQCLMKINKSMVSPFSTHDWLLHALMHFNIALFYISKLMKLYWSLLLIR